MALLPPIPPDRGRSVAAAFTGAQILVIGDAMLDRFIVGRVTRISPEAPVPIVAFDHETCRIGGAANVAHNVTALGGRATLVAVTGEDDAAATLTRACHDAGISPSLIGDAARQTTTKVRIVTERRQQVARIDYEADTEISGAIENRLVTAAQQQAAQASAIVISDYLKGVITRRVVQAVIAAAGERGVPVLVDPKIPHVEYYAGAHVVTP
ncbi:MAG TPA: PfkB family carbohydrate kinase, partial [Vicinamibacterales bacterium]